MNDGVKLVKCLFVEIFVVEKREKDVGSQVNEFSNSTECSVYGSGEKGSLIEGIVVAEVKAV